MDCLLTVFSMIMGRLGVATKIRICQGFVNTLHPLDEKKETNPASLGLRQCKKKSLLVTIELSAQNGRLLLRSTENEIEVHPLTRPLRRSRLLTPTCLQALSIIHKGSRVRLRKICSILHIPSETAIQGIEAISCLARLPEDVVRAFILIVRLIIFHTFCTKLRRESAQTRKYIFKCTIPIVLYY